MSDTHTLGDEDLSLLRDHVSKVAAEFGCTANVRITHRQGSDAQTEDASIEVTVVRHRANGPPSQDGYAVSVALYRRRGREVFDAFIRDEAGPKLRDA